MVKAGASCLKLGQNQIVNGYKFTCIKSGKKLIWDKGVATKNSPSTSAPNILQGISPGSNLINGNIYVGETLKFNMHIYTYSALLHVEGQLMDLNDNLIASSIGNQIDGNAKDGIWEIDFPSSKIQIPGNYKCILVLVDINGKRQTISDSNFNVRIVNRTLSPSPTQSQSPITLAGSKCDGVGSRIAITSESYLECRMIANDQKQYFSINMNSTSPQITTSLGNIGDCQVPDLTNRPRFEAQSAPIGYMPDRRQSPNYPTQGEFKIVILPIDFSDFPGKELDKQELKAYSELIKTWFDYESNGKLKVDVIYVDKWLRAPKISHEYNWNHPGTQNPTTLTNDQIGQDFANIADPYVDFHKVGAIFVMHPSMNQNIEYGMMADSKFQTDEGFISPFLVSNGYQVDRLNGAIWSVWIHELGHHMNLAGHSPNELPLLDLMNNQSGYGLSTTTWNQLLVDWLLPSQLYCRTINNLKEDEITLTSVDSLKPGLRSAMIALSNHEVLVIESRRKDFWTNPIYTHVPSLTKEVFDGFYGIEIYLVDTSTSPVLEPTSPGYNPNVKYNYARNIEISDTHVSEFKGINGLEYLMLQGESLTFRDIKISFTQSGDFDTIKIQKI